MPLVVALVVLLGLALVIVQRGRADQLESPFALAGEGRLLFVSQAAETGYEVDVALGDVCTPDGDLVAVRAVDLLGVDGALELTGFEPTAITARCESDEPQVFTVQVRRASGESAHADGFQVTYVMSDGTVRRARLPSGVTVCRQVSEC